MYTITEVLKLWELVEKEKIRKPKTPPISFFKKIAAENLIPDRSATSLRTAWKKFSQIRKSKFVRAALKKVGTRYSHYFDEAPKVPTARKIKGMKRNLTSIMDTASTKPKEEASNDSESRSEREQESESENMDQSESVNKSMEEMGMDMNVNTKEPSIIDNGNEDMEFVLEIENMQSAISQGPEGTDSSYPLNPRKSRRTRL